MERARDYYRASETLATDAQWQNALEQAHFSVELAMKAAITKAGYENYPQGKDGHNLTTLAGCQIAPFKKTLRKKAQENRGIQSTFNEVLSGSAWQMHHRYEKHPLDSESIGDFAEKYWRIYLWVMTNYVES